MHAYAQTPFGVTGEARPPKGMDVNVSLHKGDSTSHSQTKTLLALQAAYRLPRQGRSNKNTGVFPE